MSMDAMEASKARQRLWADLKPLLIRSLGHEGAADWLLFAGQQMHLEAKRKANNVIELKPMGWAP